MGKTSKELLQLEHNLPSSSSFKESALLVCETGNTKHCLENKKQTCPPFSAPLPSSQVLGKVKDFLGVISEANQNLELNAKDKPDDYNIEALKGDESEYIEMDLMLGVADLYTPEAIAAAEAALAGDQRVLNLCTNDDDSSEADSSSDDDEEEDSDDDAVVQDDGPVKPQIESKKKRKRAGIVELS